MEASGIKPVPAGGKLAVFVTFSVTRGGYAKRDETWPDLARDAASLHFVFFSFFFRFTRDKLFIEPRSSRMRKSAMRFLAS